MTENNLAPEQYFYFDTMYGDFVRAMREPLTETMAEVTLVELRAHANHLSLPEIKKELQISNPARLRWLEQYEQKKFEEIEVDTSKLYIDRQHFGLDGVAQSQGKAVSTFLQANKNNPKVRARIDGVLHFFASLRNIFRLL